MTNERFHELGDLTKWFWKQNREIAANAAKEHGQLWTADRARCEQIAGKVLNQWWVEKQAEAGVSQAEWDEYEVWQEGMAEAIVSRREEEMRYG